MSYRVLLVTGARSLADSPDAEAWARGLIADALAGADLLIVGDAPGPDAWAWAIAESAWFDGLAPSERKRLRVDPYAVHRRVHCYATSGSFTGDVILHDGLSVYGGQYVVETAFRWAQSKRPRGGEEYRQWFLARNAAMVRDAAADHSIGHTVRVLALLDGRKATARGRVTRGTEHTVGLARKAGLTVDAQTWGES